MTAQIHSENIFFLISAEELNTYIGTKKNLVIIDVRAKEEYEKGHIPGAVSAPEIFTYLPEGLSSDEEKNDFVEFFKNLFGNIGIQKDEFVVLYEERYTLKSPRGLMILKYLGYSEDNIRVLEGGYFNYLKSNYNVETASINAKSKQFIPHIDENLFVDYNEMLDIINDNEITVLDTRDKDEWIGISSSPYGIDFAPKKGRLPNAVWIEWYHFITHDMLSMENTKLIEQKLQEKGIHKNTNIVLYCFKGARLSNSYIALRKLGYQNIRIYFAGWNEWCRKENAPIINESENTDNLILKENIALKLKLDKLNTRKAKLIDFPKFNPEPIFSFSRDGKLDFFNASKLHNLPNITKYADIFPNKRQKDIYNIIDNMLEDSVTVFENGKYYLLKIRGSRDQNKILVYGFDTTILNELNIDLEVRVKKATYNLQEQVEEELKKNRDKDFLLIQQSRLAQMGEMISMIAHQWRQPLGAISSTIIDMQMKIALEVFDLETKDGVEEAIKYAKKRLENINLYVQNLTTTIDDFRDFYKPNKKSVRVKLKKVTIKSLDIIKASLISNNIEIIEEYNSDEELAIYENEMMQVILNLLKNAQDNLKEKETKNPYIKITTNEKMILICDNGGGIPKDVVDKIFDPYFSTKNDKNGTGLGLYMSKMIVEEHHNGKIDAQNQFDSNGESMGVCFRIDLKSRE